MARKADVSTGDRWEVKISGEVKVVEIMATFDRAPGGFHKVSRPMFVGINVATGREIRGNIMRLRRRIL